MQSLRLEKELSDAKLHFLKSQLHPHFLFNTMHTIANLIRDKSYHTAIETISGFSELLRLSLANLNTQFVSLKEEFDYLDLYLNIEKIRFKDRLSTVVEIPSEVLSCKVPFLLLQPFVENSIKHGLIKQEDSLLIHISASRNNQNLVVIIEDDGSGFPDDWSFEKNSGIGLQNIHRRLSTIYGSNFTMELQNRNNSGVTVTIVIPFSRKVE
ncbi:MAG: histidine kinase [Thermoplasmata archaeon]|nr:MAG: histidine kinase [Thermoplasmata archaeon]